ncbi:hypothetical protein Glove_186g83 [Diversispora epigaea]|uniref:DNA-directed DNA polymerase n=1 Tax=Diversispora epigaea TaxID=1348612 RepID=A0A397IWK4_9GLOM|nr:hypothetical protein Glove_186g83 [Diversispora epigaea]
MLDIQIRFSDSQYDWPFIIEKAKSLGILEWMYNHMSSESSNIEKILKWNHQKSEIKIDNEKFYSKYFKIPGCIPINVCTCFKKLYQKSEASSLKYYLEKCELDSKVDMPITTMNRIYEDTILNSSDISAKNMCEVANYCVINARDDALRCQELIVKHNVINNYQEVSSIAYVSLSDSHYFMGNMKIYNLLGAEAWSSNMLCSMIASENTESGLENKCPVIGLDFASLYPSLMMTYNLLLDKIILSRGETINALHSGKKLHKIKFSFNGRTIETWSIRHNNMPKEKSLYVRVLKNLFNKQKKMKECLNELDEKSFEYSCLDSKQKAVKSYINTFYGEAVNGGVTSAGRRNIKFIKKFVEDKGFDVKYASILIVIFCATCPLCVRGYPSDNTGLEHKKEPNFNLGELFIKGVDIVKRDQSKFFYDVEKLFKLDYDEFIQTYIWRPKKESKQGNISIECHKVLENQQLIKKGLSVNKYLYKVPKPGEQFSYIVVVPEKIYNNCRKKISQKKEDCIEYLNMVKRFNKKINIDYYTESLFALYIRFINYNDKYQPSPESLAKALDRKKKSKKKKLKNVKDLFCENSSQKNNTYFNILDEHEKSIRSKLSILLMEISNLFTGYREYLHILVNESHKYSGVSVKTHISKSTILEKYILIDVLESECEVLIDFWNT